MAGTADGNRTVVIERFLAELERRVAYGGGARPWPWLRLKGPAEGLG